MTVLEERWAPARHLILGDDPQVRLFGEITVWYKKIELFRRGEEERMYRDSPTAEDLAMHRRLLQRLLADGEHLLALVHQVGLPDNVSGMTTESVAATVELLDADYRGWHQPMLPGERQRLMRELFPDVP